MIEDAFLTDDGAVRRQIRSLADRYWLDSVHTWGEQQGFLDLRVAASTDAYVRWCFRSGVSEYSALIGILWVKRPRYLLRCYREAEGWRQTLRLAPHFFWRFLQYRFLFKITNDPA